MNEICSKFVSLSNKIQRPLLCMIWMAAFFLAFLDLIPALDDVGEEQGYWGFKVFVYFIIGIVAASMHTYLIPKNENSGSDDDSIY
jgi:hypothetical protein